MSDTDERSGMYLEDWLDLLRGRLGLDRGQLVDAEIAAGGDFHLLTAGSPARFAVRVTRGRLDRRGRFHDRQLDTFAIWHGCRYDWGELWQHVRERGLARLARLVPRPVRYFVVINEAVAVSHAEPQKVVPEITWADMAKRLEASRG